MLPLSSLCQKEERGLDKRSSSSKPQLSKLDFLETSKVVKCKEKRKIVVFTISLYVVLLQYYNWQDYYADNVLQAINQTILGFYTFALPPSPYNSHVFVGDQI